MINSISDFRNKFFCTIKPQGFIKTMRGGSTGIGYTLEQLYEIEENSSSTPDFSNIDSELKAKRKKSKASLLTLYTDESGWTLPQIDFIENYGWNHRKHLGEKTVQSTIKIKKNKRGFWLDVSSEDNLCVVKDGFTFMKWSWNDILTHYMAKFKNLIVVDAEVQKIDDVDYFHYVSFNYYQGTSKEQFRRMIEDNKIGIDLRLYTQYNLNKGVRNRGTALRIKHKDVKDLYTTHEYFVD